MKTTREAQAPPHSGTQSIERALRILREMDVNHLTPLEALNQLFALHAMLKHS